MCCFLLYEYEKVLHILIIVFKKNVEILSLDNNENSLQINQY